MKNYIIIALIFIGNYAAAQTSKNIDSLKKAFPNEKIFTFKEEVELEYFYDKDGKVKAKTKNKVVMIILEDKDRYFSDISLSYNDYQTADLIYGKLYYVDSKGERTIIENVKLGTKKDRNYFMNSIFFSDAKLRQYRIFAEDKTRFILEYSFEEIYHDLKFLTIFQPSPSFPLVNYSFKIKTTPKIDADISLHGIDSLFKISESKSNDTTIRTYELKNFESLKTSYNSLPSAYYMPHLIVHTKSVINKNGQKQTIINTADDLYNWYAELVATLKPDKTYLKNLSDKIVAGKTTQEEKIEAIYKWVQNNITYVAFEDGIAGFLPEEAQNVAQLSYGDCKGMANLLVELLKSQGFNAYHCWIGTRHKPYSYSTPSLSVDNHMICALNYNGKYYYLDGTGKEFLWKDVPYHLEGKEAMVGLDRNKYVINKLPLSSPANNSIIIDLTLDFANKNNDIEGVISLNGQYKTTVGGNKNSTPHEYLNKFPERFIDYIFDNAFIIAESNISETDKGYKFSFKGKEAGLLFNNTGMSAVMLPKLYILPLKPIIPQKDAPIELDFPTTLKININVKNIPVSANVKTAIKDEYTGLGNQEISVNKTGENSAIISYQLVLNKNQISGADISLWNQLTYDFSKKYFIVKL